LIAVVTNGLHASAIPYFSDLLSVEEIKAVVALVKSFSSVFDGPLPQPLSVPPRLPSDEASIARGQALYRSAGCAGCHGPDGRARMWLLDTKGYPVIARDLTAPWTFRGGSEPEAIWLRLTTGLAPGPMPPHADTLTPEQRWEVVNYVLSLARTPPWEGGGRLDGPGQDADRLKRGRYLIRAEMCGLCHTQINAPMIYSGDAYYLAGGMGVPAYPQDFFISRNLTSDPETGLGHWTEAQIVDAIRNGRAPDRILNVFDMPWNVLHFLSDDDALAIATYLKSLPPVRNQIPDALHYGVVETVMAKAAYSTSLPPLGRPDALMYRGGNFGRTAPGWLPRHWPQTALVGGQWLVLAFGLVAFALVAPPGRRLPRGFKEWTATILAVLGLILLAALGYTMYHTPALPFVPPEVVANSSTASIPIPDPASFDTPERAALAERGRYLYTITSCALCHGNRGAGGIKLSASNAFGTLWVRNITSDPATGIGAWSDAEIARAIRSGVTPDGRQLHWQAMIWDHLSNLDEEDVRSIIVYLRTLPPVVNQIPPPRPPAADDCAEYTFYNESTYEPGCE
jgi:mono/diheme cytochrome c family protein